MIEEFTAMKSLKHLAVLHALGLTRSRVRDLCFLRRINQTHNIGVLANLSKHIEIIQINFVFIQISLISHTFQGDAPLAVVHCGHCASTDLFEHLELVSIVVGLAA